MGDPSVTGEEPATTAEPAGRRRATVAITLAVAAVAVVSLIVWLVQRGGDAEAGGPDVASGTTAPASTPADPAATATPTVPVPSETAPVPAPTTPPSSAPPLPIDGTATVAPGTSVVLERLEAVEGEALLPGEVAGPSVRVTVAVRNTTATPVSLASAVVTATYGPQETPALDLRGPGGSPFPPEVAAGGSATGVFVFRIPPDQRDVVRIVVDYAVGVPLVVFEGAAPPA